MKGKGRVKQGAQRRGKKKVTFKSIVTKISKRTGYSKPDVKEVIDELVEIMVEELKKDNIVMIPQIGMIYPAIKPPFKATKMIPGTNKAEVFTVPAKYEIRLRQSSNIKVQLNKALEVTQSKIDELYK